MSKLERGWAYAAIGLLFVSVMMATTEPTAKVIGQHHPWVIAPACRCCSARPC